MELYPEIILEHSKRPHHTGLREPFNAQVHHINATCGDEVTLRVQRIGDDRSGLLADWDSVKRRFTLVLPRDYQRVLDVRATAESEGLDLNGTQAWGRIMEASRG